MSDKKMTYEEQVAALRDAFERTKDQPSDDESLPEYMPLPSDGEDTLAIGFKKAPKHKGKSAD